MKDIKPGIISCLEKDFPVCSRPFQVLAAEAGMTEAELLHELKNLSDRGIVRRFGAVLGHRTLGFSANAMVVWQAPEDRIAAIGSRLARIPRITHCYHRRPAPDWPYNLYTMIHGTSRENCRRIVEEAVRVAGITTYLILYSTRELKKTSLQYFNDRKDGTPDERQSQD
jgi:DNA-binding Lrp family transcriptional regulator